LSKRSQKQQQNKQEPQKYVKSCLCQFLRCVLGILDSFIFILTEIT